MSHLRGGWDWAHTPTHPLRMGDYRFLLKCVPGNEHTNADVQNSVGLDYLEVPRGYISSYRHSTASQWMCCILVHVSSRFWQVRILSGMFSVLSDRLRSFLFCPFFKHSEYLFSWIWMTFPSCVKEGPTTLCVKKSKATVVVDFTVCLILNFICLVIFVFAFSFELHFCASHLRHYLHHPTSPPKLRMKYVVCSCPLEQTQTVEVYSDLMPLLAGRHHFSVLLKLLQLTVKINQLMTML